MYFYSECSRNVCLPFLNSHTRKSFFRLCTHRSPLVLNCALTRVETVSCELFNNPSASFIMAASETIILSNGGTIRQRSGKGTIRKRFPLQKPKWEKINLQSGTLTMKTFCRMRSYLPNRWPLSYLNLTKNLKIYIRRQ